MDDLTAIAARVGALETPNDLIQLLRDGGRRITPVELQALGHAGFSKDAELQGSLLNPGDGAPLWLLRGDRKRDVALVSRALRRHARSAPTGCSAAFVVDAAGTAIHVALATDDAPEHCASTARNIDARALDAWAAFVSTRHSAVACLRAFRLLRKRAVGAAFFRDVRASVQQISGGWLQGPTDPLQRHALSMTFLCRMMFLYFVQQKQWLDGDAGFMAALVLDPRTERIYGQRLRPLFFDVLNRPVDGRPEAWAARRIPYLNGGLFTESPLEREWPELSLPDEVLRELVESTLERYRFVEAEDEARVGVDPEMLGAVFESLMHPAQRGDTGTFYTPVRLVEECVTDALSESLGARVGDDIAAVLMSDQSLEPAELPAVRAALDDIRVLDPAMGSGAFLLGALRKLTALRRVAFGEDEATATRAVIQSSLYGVDTSASAVTIAELRIWLALAAVLPDGGDVEPLPNLGHRFRRGNALIGVSHWSAFDGARPAPGAHERLADLAEAFGAAHGREKARLAEELRAAELAVAVSLLEAAARVKEAEVRGLEARKLPDLMGIAAGCRLRSRVDCALRRRQYSTCVSGFAQQNQGLGRQRSTSLCTSGTWLRGVGLTPSLAIPRGCVWRGCRPTSAADCGSATRGCGTLVRGSRSVPSRTSRWRLWSVRWGCCGMVGRSRWWFRRSSSRLDTRRRCGRGCCAMRRFDACGTCPTARWRTSPPTCFRR